MSKLKRRNWVAKELTKPKYKPKTEKMKTVYTRRQKYVKIEEA